MISEKQGQLPEYRMRQGRDSPDSIFSKKELFYERQDG